MTDPRQAPAINLPPVIVGIVGFLLAVHLGVSTFLSEQALNDLFLKLAFIPARYLGPEYLQGFVFPGGPIADVTTFVTYGLLHADWTHAGMNVLWLVAFGAPVAVRLGVLRFLGLAVFSSAAGAGLHLAAHWGEIIPLIGASAGVAGVMGGAARFIFAGNGALMVAGRANEMVRFVPRESLSAVLRNKRALVFIGVWLAVNFIFGAGSLPIVGEGASIAWEAHVGGFVFGFLFFALFDPPIQRLEDDIPPFS